MKLGEELFLPHRECLPTCSHSLVKGVLVMLGTILWVIVVILVVLWLLGWLAFHIASPLIHVLIVVAVIVLLYNLFVGRRRRSL
jgi:Family of unknown function (DUF5670)